jgi:hypothetical protein
MDWVDRLNALHFNDNQPLDNQVDPIPKLDSFAVVDNGQADLSSNAQSAFCQFML